MDVFPEPSVAKDGWIFGEAKERRNDLLLWLDLSVQPTVVPSSRVISDRGFFFSAISGMGHGVADLSYPVSLLPFP